mgnify:FL=1
MSIQDAKNISEELFHFRLLNYYRLSFLLFVLVATPLFFLSEYLVLILYGYEYQPAGVLLAIMSSRLLFANMGVARSVYLLTENQLKFGLITMVIGTIINVILNYVWISEYGSKGAIAATIVSFFVTIFAIDALYTRTRNNFKLQIFAIITFYKIRI